MTFSHTISRAIQGIAPILFALFIGAIGLVLAHSAHKAMGNVNHVIFEGAKW